MIIQTMILSELINTFIGTHFTLLISLFAVGISSLLSRTYSQACVILSVLGLALFFLTGMETFFIALSILAFLVGLILKNIGM